MMVLCRTLLSCLRTWAFWFVFLQIFFNGRLPLTSMLLGPDREFSTEVPREKPGPVPTVRSSANPPNTKGIGPFLSQQRRVQLRTYDEPLHFHKPVVLLINQHMQSEPEILSAAMNEDGRAPGCLALGPKARPMGGRY